MSSEILSCVNSSYSIHEALPPIFGSQVCFTTKSRFVSKCLPSLARVTMVHVTEDDILLEAAEDAVLSMRGKFNTVMKMQEKEQRVYIKFTTNMQSGPCLILRDERT